MATTDNRKLPKLPSPGPYVGEITNHLDPTYMGMVEVILTKGFSPSRSDIQSVTYPVRYLSPFYGVTSVRYEGNDSSNFNDVQKSYGMWMVPPDVGTTVLVIFIDGDPNQGYWIGCVPDAFQNHMVPGIAASKQSAMNSDQVNKYGTSYLPVAEIHKTSQLLNAGSNVDKIPKAIHPFADRLFEQGLLFDTIRGPTSSSARREIPSSVFGISTPGPLDTSPNYKKGKVGYEGNRQAPVSRLGGTTFVMDDGDVNGENELVRIRTRTGHQVLLHNTKDLIYIANAAGTSWIEMTGNGKIDIYAADSVSIHSENDINLRADRDFNIEAGRNLKMVASAGIQLESGSDFNVLSSNDMHLQTSGEVNIYSSTDMFIAADGELNVKGTGAVLIGGDSTLDIQGRDTVKIGSSKELNVYSSATMYIGADKDINISAAGNIYETAILITANGVPAVPPAKPNAPDDPTTANYLPRFPLPNRARYYSPDKPLTDWQTQYFKSADIMSIMSRVPTHEPYDQHEDIDQARFSTTATDVTKSGGPSSQVNGGLIKSVKSVFSGKSNVQGTPPAKTGNAEQDNVAAFLWMIRVCEGTSGPDGYRTMFTGSLFDITDPTLPTYQYAKHPKIVNRANGISSTAAGAYQFLYSTWNFCKQSLALSDFSPASQDLACIFLLAQNNSLDNIKTGNFSVALNQNRRTWASLPSAGYPGQPTKTVAFCQKVYTQGGGTIVA